MQESAGLVLHWVVKPLTHNPYLYQRSEDCKRYSRTIRGIQLPCTYSNLYTKSLQRTSNQPSGLEANHEYSHWLSLNMVYVQVQQKRLQLTVALLYLNLVPEPRIGAVQLAPDSANSPLAHAIANFESVVHQATCELYQFPAASKCMLNMNALCSPVGH